MILSAIDIQWPGNLGLLVPALERFGYHRFWTTEHHSPSQSASPLVAAAILCGMTSTIRIGTAGVLLPYTSPLQVLEAFRLLELFYPGRLDMGVAAANAGDESISKALLDERPVQTPDMYARKVTDLAGLVNAARSHAGDDGKVAGPAGPSLPSLWVCGSGIRSARLAASLGVCYSYHAYIGRQREGDASGPEVLSAYRNAFVATERQATPECNVAVFGACSASGREARRVWESFFGIGAAGVVATAADAAKFTPETIPEPCFCGDVARCKEQLLAIQESYGIDELVVQCVGTDVTQIIRSYRVLAENVRG